MSAFSIAEWIGLMVPAAAFLIIPRLSPRGYFFGLSVAPEFRESANGRAIENRFRLWVAAACIAGMVLAAAFPRELIPAISFVCLAGIVAFFNARHRVFPFAISRQAATDLPAPGPLPRWTLLAVPPFAILMGVALYLRAHWNEIPERFPVHWGMDGQPNRWVERSAHGVYGPLGFGAIMVVFIMAIGVASWYGSRPSPLRAAVLKMLVAVSYMLAVMFGTVGLLPLRIFPPGSLVIVALLFVPVVLIYAAKLASNDSVPAEPTPDSCWKLSSIYYNPADPALFVQKRLGFGYTFNFANRFSWMILVFLLALVLAAVFLLR